MNADLNDLVDSHEVAAILGLSSNQAVSTYRSRYSDFPPPAVVKSAGKCILWLRGDIEAWRDSRLDRA